MFQRLLVPYDGSDEAAPALEAAHALAAHEDHPHVTLLRVIPHARGADERAQIERALERLAASLRREGISAEALVAVGDPDEVVATTAARDRADLVVLAPYHRQWLDALLRRSLSATLLSRCPVPVLLLPSATPHEAGHTAQENGGHAMPTLLGDPAALVIVPLDGGPQAEQALPVAAAVAAQSQSTLMLVRALLPVVAALSTGEVAALERDATANAERAALHYLRDVRRRLEGKTSHFAVQTMVRVGGAAEVILDLAHAHTGSVIVMGARGKAAATTRAMLGSVALAVARGARTPVIVVPECAAVPRETVAST
jgi:nucleotide-binding universal stress UspA family protein